jgi:hypothetical protein
MSLNSPPPSASVSLESFNKCVNNKVNLNANGAVNFLPANPDRVYAIFVNSSSEEITLILGDTTAAAVGKGIPLIPGANYEINKSNLYTGKISAISSAISFFSFVEGSK